MGTEHKDVEMWLCVGQSSVCPLSLKMEAFVLSLNKKKKGEKKTISCCIPAKSMESPGTSERKMEQGANCRWELRKGQERNLYILKDLAESLELP